MAGQAYTATKGDPDSVKGKAFDIGGLTVCTAPNYVNAAKIPQDHSCADEPHQCQSGLECAEVQEVDNEANAQSICIPTEACSGGEAATYTAEHATDPAILDRVFAITASTVCLGPKIMKDESCATNIDDC